VTPAAESAATVDWDALRELAREAMSHAYAPYSGYPVGVAALVDDGRTISGCNVENASYGLTNCAERTAIFKAVSEEGSAVKIRAIAVTNAQNVACSPCGACRQVIYEFGPGATVVYQGNKGYVSMLARDLLPAGFTLL
jgi:cytidine deaminase